MARWRRNNSTIKRVLDIKQSEWIKVQYKKTSGEKKQIVEEKTTENSDTNQNQFQALPVQNTGDTDTDTNSERVQTSLTSVAQTNGITSQMNVYREKQ